MKIMKKMKILMVLLLVCLNVSGQLGRPEQIVPLNAPVYCSTVSPPLSPAEIKRNSSASRSDEQYCFQVKFHVVNKCDGSISVTQDEIDVLKNHLNTDFNPMGISFNYFPRIDYIGPEHGFCNSPSLYVFEHNPDPNAIDIYLFDEEDQFNSGGRADIIGTGTALYLAGKFHNDNFIHYPPNNMPISTSKVVSHEMAHLFGLRHPHFGPAEDITGTAIWENPNGSECLTAGDGVCDTPPDPYIFFYVDPNNNCTWDGQVYEYSSNPRPYGLSLYTPFTNNIMSYTHPNCLSSFTTGQQNWMRNHIRQDTKGQLTPALSDECSLVCEDYPKSYDGMNYKTGVMATDKDNSVIFSGRSPGSNFTLEGANYDYFYSLSKFDQDGCLVFVNEINATGNLKTDNENNIYTSNWTSANLTKLASHGDIIWSYEDPNYTIVDFDFNDENILVLGKNHTTNKNEIRQINIINGLLMGITELDTNKARNLVTSKSSNDFYISVSINSGSLSFGTSTINYDGNDTDIVLLKYTISGGSISPTSHFQYIDTEFGVGSLPVYVINFNSSTGHFLFYLDNTLEIYNQNLNPILERIFPFDGFGTFRRANFREDTNTFSVLTDGKLYKIRDQSPYTIEMVSLNSDVLNLYYEISGFYNLYGLNTNHALTNDDKLYIVGQSSESGNIAVLSKADANNGNLLDRSANTSIDETEISKKLSSKDILKIYPNPFDNSIRIHQNVKNPLTQVILYNKIGNIVLEQNVPVTGKTIELNTSKLPKGIYFIKRYFIDGTSEVRQIVKD